MNSMIEIMEYVPETKKKVSNITVIGVGGGGSNAVEYMYNQGINDVEFMICNTDMQALNAKSVPLKIMIGKNLAGGLGAGADPKVGEAAAKESEEEIRNAFKTKKTKMIFITAGMGGGTGTGAAPIIAKIAREMGILAVGIVTMPLKSEGRDRMKRAKEGLANLKEHLDAILIIDNAMVLKIFGDLTWEEAFHKADDILAIGAKSLAEILIKEYHMNVDFKDVSKTMRDTGFFLMGTATAKSSDENVVDTLINSTLQSPLLMQNDISGAKNILLALTSGANGFKASKTDEVLSRIQDIADGEAEVITALGKDLTLAEDEVKLIIIATGFDSAKFKNYDTVPQKLNIPLPKTILPNDDEVHSDVIENELNEEGVAVSLIAVASEDDETLKRFETVPAYIRMNKDIFQHIDPGKQKIEKLKLIDF